MRTPVVGGNWKMNTTRVEAEALLRDLRESLGGLSGNEIVILPPAPWLPLAADILSSSDITVGAQNVYWEASGAFTGEVSAALLKDTAQWALIGHSERRHVIGESDEEIGRKLRAVIEQGLRPILAIGELLAEREGGDTADVLQRQLDGAFDGLAEIPDGFVIAYEPVWAIGTGTPADERTAQEACAMTRSIVADRYGAESADRCRIQYGGSVNADNAASFARQPDIDGALVGGASLNAASFAEICRGFGAART